MTASRRAVGADVAEDRDGPGKYLLVLGVAAAIVLLDQATKLRVAGSMRLHETIPIVPGLFDLTYVRNTGAAFSMLAGRSAAFRIPFFTVVSLLAAVAILGFVRQTPPSRRVVLLCCAAVLGGAAGNMIDRLAYGDVIDFLLLHWRQWAWPAFNVADSFITIGVAVLLVRTLLGYDDLSDPGATDSGG